MKKLLLLFTLFAFNLTVIGQGSSCDESAPFCTDETYLFPLDASGTQLPVGPDYDCLASGNSPSWFHMRIAEEGDIEITMFSTPTVDIDFECWGPYTDPILACENLTQDYWVDCSYSGSDTEICYIPNGLVGEYYILVITNWPNVDCDVTFQKTGGLGETDCDIVPPQVGNNGPLCVGETLELTASDEPGATFEWTGPMGFFSTLQNPTRPNVILGHAGDYQVVITLDGEVSDPAATTVVINPIPNPSFTISPLSGACLDEIVSFSGSCPQSIDTWSWDFGDGNTGLGQNVNHTYTTAGNYTVELTVVSSENCEGSTSQMIWAFAPPVGDFTISTGNTACTTEDITFNASPITDIISWEWDFGDGNTGFGQSVTHQYATQGNFTITLTVTNNNNCTDVIQHNITINQAPNIDFTIIPGNAFCSDELMSVTGSSDAPISSWNWDFGDGNMGVGQSTTHSYSTFGTKIITMMVNTVDNCAADISHPVEVFEAPTASMSISVPDISCLGDQITFTGNNNANITDWNWDFGDLTSDNGEVVTHTYADAGTYDVTLIVINNNNCNDTIIHQLTVNELPTADFIVSPNDSICLGEVLSLEASGSADIVNWQWDFGDGNSGTNPITTHNFENAGIYQITSIYTTAVGCEQTTTHEQTVIDMSAVDFTLTPDISCQDFPVSIDGLGEATFTPWNWDFGDGNTAVGKNVVHTYPLAGNYNVTLDLCVEQVIHPLLVNATCFADAGEDILSCEDAPVTITTADADNYSSLIWTHNGLGNLVDANTLNPTYTPAAGEFNTTVILTLSTTAFPPCADQTDFMELQINEGSSAFAGSDEFACAELSYDFANSTLSPAHFPISGSIIWTLIGVDPSGGSFQSGTQTNEKPVYNLGTNTVAYPFTLTFEMSVETPPFCQESDIMELTVVDYQPGTLVTTDQTICYNIVPALMEVTAPTGGVGTYSYQWQSSTDNVNFTDIAGATDLTYQSIPSLLETTYFRNVQSCDCGSKITPTITVNVWDEFLAGAPAADEGICFSIQPQLLTPDAPTGGDGVYTYQWQSSLDNITFTDIVGETAISYQPPILTQTTYYRQRQSNFCGIVFTPTTTISVLDEFIPGGVSPDELICFNTQPTQLVADPPTGGDGNYTYQWQSSLDNVTFTDVAGATALSYQPGLLTTTTYYQLNQTCICGTITTDVITIDVHPDYNVGSISGDQTICYNTAPAALIGTAPTGGDGTYSYQWQSSTNNVTFLDIPGATLIDYLPSALTTTTYFRQVQTSGSGCGVENTNTVTITVYNEFLAGTATGEQTICFNTIPALTLHATAPTGGDGIYTYQWEKSTAGAPFTAIGGATMLDYIEPNNLMASTDYRLMQTTSCGVVYTNIVTITVNDPPNVVAISDITSACVNNGVIFNGFSTDNVTWAWDFDDGTTSTDQNPPPHSFAFGRDYMVTLTVTDNIGCSNIDTVDILVVDPPIADFSYQVDTCQKIIFTDESIAPEGYFLVDWYWEMGDGTTETGPTFRHQYPAGGLYIVTMTVTSELNGDFCSNTITLPVIVPNTPTIYYTFDPDTTCLGETTYFYGASGTEITSWYWNFDDGLDSTGQYTGHIYDNPGSYDVTLYITDTNLCQNSLTQTVIINDIPDVSMQIFSTPNCANSPISFMGDSPQGIASWMWDFGDGGISENQNPDHIFTNPGTYTITLTATDSAGCSGTTTGTVQIVPSPTADYSYSMSGCNLFSFTDLSTAPAGYQIVGWEWDFGDGSFSSFSDPTHTYAVGGFYDVKLVVFSEGITPNHQCTDSITQTILAPDGPSANFFWNPNPAQQDESISFVGTSGSNIVTWAWDFDDGFTATGQNTTHTFDNPGDYDVSLTVTDNNGCVFEQIITVPVAGLPPVDFSWAAACEDTPVQFTVDETITDVGAVDTYYWDFGDGLNSTDQNPLHAYITSGLYNATLTITDTLGYSNSITHEIDVKPNPISVFAIETPNCEDTPTQFTNYSVALSGFITTWEWDFNDGSPIVTINHPDDPDVSHTYTGTGTFSPTLTVTSSDGCTHTSEETLSITPAPIAQIDVTQGCTSGPVTFHDVSNLNGSGDIINREWNFGDPASGASNTSDLVNPTHIFSSPGDYDISLIIESSSGCTDTATVTITVTEAPEVDFTFTPACMTEEVSFTITDLTDLDTFFWDFGDGNTSVQPDPTNQYDTPGDFEVTLVVETIDGCSATMSHTVTVNPLPTASFEYSQPTCQGDTINFLNLSNSPNGAIVKWEWDFGDGTTLTLLAPNSGNTSHVYSNDQPYNVTLTVTDSDSCQNFVTREVISVASPVAEFNWEDACYGMPTNFFDLTNSTEDIATWYWDFGDPLSGTSNTSTIMNPSHIFTDPADYTVTLIVTNTQGCDDTITHDLGVAEAPNVSISITQDTICANTPVSFEGSSTSEISTWFWDFGDGGSAIAQNADYIYTTPGTYTVTLTVTGLDGCEAVASEQITVKDVPLANFIYQNACLGDSTYFTDESYSQLGYIASWDWNFGDGTTSTDQNPTHLYTINDDYQVTLIVMDNYGCSDTIQQWVKVRTSPIAKIEDFVQVCDPIGQVYFFDGSEPGADGSPIQTWEWNLNEGYYSSEIDPEYIYDITDTCYQVTLTVTDDNGCYSIDTVEVCVFGTLEVDITADQVCLTQPTTFYAHYLPESDSVASYTWDFHDGTPQITDYRDSIQHTFANPGIYNVELVAVDTNGCSAYASIEIQVDSLPTPRFSYEAGACEVPMQFTDESLTGGNFIEFYFWDFGDAGNTTEPNTSTEENPTHLYLPNDSTYTVKLIVTNFNGCTDSITQEVTTQACLLADFYPPELPLCSNNEICFADSSSFITQNGNITTWDWDFGDGQTMSYTDYQTDVCHSYEGYDGATYEVTLSLTGEIGTQVYTNSITKLVTISSTPEAMILLDNNCFNDTTYLMDGSDAHGIPLTTWNWDLDTINTGVITSSEQNPKYKYDNFGSYWTKMIVTNEAGCSDSTTREVTIYDLPTAAFSIADTCQGYYTSFYDESLESGSPIGNWTWIFGDTQYPQNDTARTQDAQHIYQDLGDYTATLMIEDDNTCKDTITRTFTINPVPTALFTLTENWEEKQGQVKLDNMSVGTTELIYDWYFDDGDTSQQVNPTHQYLYDSDPIYNLMLVATNNYGCPDTLIYPYELLFTGLYVPNAFSPSLEDPAFTTFKPVGINLSEYKLEVFSSWGNVVFTSTQLVNGEVAQGWDGTFEGEDLPTGTYIWRITARFSDGSYWRGSDNGDGNLETHGTVTLIR